MMATKSKERTKSKGKAKPKTIREDEDVSLDKEDIGKRLEKIIQQQKSEGVTSFGWVLSRVTFTTISENWKLATMAVGTRPILIGKQ
jgi:hypothetical protein